VYRILLLAVLHSRCTVQLRCLPENFISLFCVSHKATWSVGPYFCKPQLLLLLLRLLLLLLLLLIIIIIIVIINIIIIVVEIIFPFHAIGPSTHSSTSPISPIYLLSRLPAGVTDGDLRYGWNDI